MTIERTGLVGTVSGERDVGGNETSTLVTTGAGGGGSNTATLGRGEASGDVLARVELRRDGPWKDCSNIRVRDV